MIFFFNDTATTEIYTLSLHDALPICQRQRVERRGLESRSGRRAEAAGGGPPLRLVVQARRGTCVKEAAPLPAPADRKSTRLNSSHGYISYAVFCLKKKKNTVDICTLN